MGEVLFGRILAHLHQLFRSKRFKHPKYSQVRKQVCVCAFPVSIQQRIRAQSQSLIKKQKNKTTTVFVCGKKLARMPKPWSQTHPTLLGWRGTCQTLSPHNSFGATVMPVWPSGSTKAEQSQTFGSNNFPLPLVFLKKNNVIFVDWGRRKSHHLTSDIWVPQLQTDKRQFSWAVTGAEGKGQATEVS